MTQNSNSRSCCGTSLCSVCGTNINTEDVDFSRTEANLVYMDKVYSYNKATACPILQSFTVTDAWSTELILKENENSDCDCDRCNCGCNCGCNRNCGCECTLTAEAVFTVTRSFVLVSSLTLPNGALVANDVTVDGIAVDSLTQRGNRYIATTDNLITQVNRKRCQELGLPSKNFLLITGAGPWIFRGTIVLEGTVNTGGKTCCFQARFTTPDAGFTIGGESTFAVPKLSLPCSINGVSPTIEFSFTGLIYVLNPQLTVRQNNGNLILNLTGSLAVQPQLNVEVVRRTLFCIQACEGILPCDGTETAFELDSDDDDCTWPPSPACRCGTKASPLNDADICDRSVSCSFEDDSRSCNCTGGETREERENNGFQWNGCNGCSW